MRKKQRIWLLAAGCIFFCSRLSPALATTPVTQVIQVEETGDTYWVETAPAFEGLRKPSVAVALGGGGARALVNVGVLKALEEERIPIDLVVGTSMGAVMAVMYGSGIPVAAMEEIAAEGILPSTIDFNPPFFKSLLCAAKLNNLLERLAPAKNLEDFPLPTALLSLDLTNEVKYIHTTGRISKVLQSVYAIPFMFPVCKNDDAYRVDAGMVELTPALAARVLGADLVISTTAYDTLPFTEYHLPLRAFMKMLDLANEGRTKMVVERYSDVIIDHDVGQYSFNDFHLAEHFIDLGYRRTKELLPRIKEKLAAKGIALREKNGAARAGEQAVDLATVLSDYRRDRVVENRTVKPKFYFGKEHALFHRRYFQNDLPAPQYGLLVDTGRVELVFYTKGAAEKNLEFKGRIKKLRPDWDLLCLAAVIEEKVDYELLFVRYFDSGRLGLGAARLSGVDYAHWRQSYGFNLKRCLLAGDFNLFVSPWNRWESEYCLTGELLAPLGDSFAVRCRLVLGETKHTPAPRVYRGFQQAACPEFQAALESLYEWKFLYSKELFRFIQWTGMEFFQFIDTQKTDAPAYAAGCGFQAGFRIIGLKPLFLGGYLSYDFTGRSVQVVLTADISI